MLIFQPGLKENSAFLHVCSGASRLGILGKPRKVGGIRMEFFHFRMELFHFYSLWNSSKSSKFFWIPLNCVVFRGISMFFFIFLSILLSSCEFVWIPRNSYEFLWILLRFLAFCWIVRNSVEFFWIPWHAAECFCIRLNIFDFVRIPWEFYESFGFEMIWKEVKGIPMKVNISGERPRED